MGRKLIFIFALLTSTVGFAHGPGMKDGLFDGLDECIPYDMPEKFNAIQLPEVDHKKNPQLLPPISDDDDAAMYVNNLSTDHLTYKEQSKLYYSVFPNQEFVYMPPEAQILRSSETESPYNWIFPDGMMFFHRFEIKKLVSESPQFFELRMIKRIKGKWAFGVYSRALTQRCAGQLELRKFPITAEMKLRAYRNTSKGLASIEFRGKPLNPRSCVDCHGLGFDGDPSQIGPCNYKFIETLQNSIDYPLFGLKHL